MGILKSDKKAGRFLELEGMRGIAAVAVVVFHIVALFYGQMVYGPGVMAPVQHMRFEDNFYANPIAALWSGTFAVAIFFVLSGFVLSIGYLQSRKREHIERLAIKRYLRLVLPVLASIFGCYLLIKFNLDSMQTAAGIIHSDTLAKAWELEPSLLTVLKDGLVGVFVGGVTSYNVVLWTMTVEFLGSFMVFAALLLFAHSKYRWMVYGALLVASFGTWFMAFFIGMMLADLYSHGVIRQAKRNLLQVLLVAIVALYLGGYPYGDDLGGTLYAPLQALPLGEVDYRMLSLTLGATLLVWIVLQASQLTALFQRKYISILGKYTFSLYLVHLPILWTVTLGMFVFLYGMVGYNAAVIVSVVASVPVIWLATVLFEKYIDSKSVVMASYWADVYAGRRRFNGFTLLRRRLVSVQAAVLAARQRIMGQPEIVLENEVE